MSVTRIGQDHIKTLGSSINDGLTPTDHDANAVDLQDTIDYIASQLKAITGEAAWETAPDSSIASMWAKTWLEDKKAPRDRLVLTDITVPAVVNGTGDDITGTAPNMTLTDAGGSFTAAMVGREITIAGATTPANNGTFLITSYTSATVIGYSNASGVAETFTGTYSIAANFVVLSDAASETPSANIAINASTSGAVVAELSGDVGSHALTEVAGDNALNPQNLVFVIDADTGDPIKSSNRQVYGLLQVENGATDGGVFNDSNHQAQISFVRPNSTYDDLEACPTADIAGLDINYSYADREALSSWSAGDFRRSSVLVDLAAPGVSQSLDISYNGGSVVAVDDTNVDWRLTDTKHFYVSDSTGGANILDIHAEAAGDELEITAPGGITINSGDIAGGTNKATWNGVEVGGAAGQIATASGDLVLDGADDITFTTVRETSPLPLDDATTGSISALAGGPHASVAAAIKYAIEQGMTYALAVNQLGSNYAQDVNIPAGLGIDISSPHSIDMNTPSGVDTFIFLNGVLQWGGNGTTKNSIYAGDTPANGDVKVSYPKGVKTGDLFITLQLG